MARWVFFLILGSVLAPSLVWAKDGGEANRIEVICAQLLSRAAPSLPVDSSKLPKVSLIPEVTTDESLILQSINSMAPENYGMRGFSRGSFQGLLKIFRNKDLTERFLKQWTRLGFVRAHVKDPYYARFKLIGENHEVNVLEEMADPILQTYLLPLRKRANRGEINPVLTPVSNRQRLHTLTSMFAKTLENLDPAKADSNEVIKTVLMEINRLDIEGNLNGESFDQTFAALTGFGKYQLRNFKVPGYVGVIAGFIPFVSAAMGTVTSIWNTIYEQTVDKDRIIRHKLLEVSKERVWQKPKPKSLETVFARRDFRDLKPKAHALIEKYANVQTDVFTHKFAEDLVGAYPELNLLFNTISDEQKVETPFGVWHPDVQQVLYRAALLISVYKEDAKAFSKISRREFGILRAKMFSNLGLLDDGVVTTDEIDLLLTFFVTDVLGRAQGPLIDAIDEDFHISKIVGHYDFERRSAFLLKRYTLLSYSFARQDNADQQLILTLLDGVFTLNMEHIMRLDASAASFETLKELGRRKLSFLFYRNLLTFAGTTTGQQRSALLSSDQLQRWMSLKEILDRASEENAESKSLYAEYVSWVADFYRLPADSPDNRVALRLASIAEMTPQQLKVLQRRLAELPAVEQDVLRRYLTRYPTLVYGGHEFFEICQRAPVEGELRYAARIGLWLNSLVKIYRSLDLDPYTRANIQNTREGDVRLFIEPVADLMEREGPAAVERAHFRAEKFKFGYIIHVGF